jgi:hypothetical protein
MKKYKIQDRSPKILHACVPLRTLDIPLCSISQFPKPNRGTKDHNRAMWEEKIRIQKIMLNARRN